jgi:hypothetical protein
MRDKGRRKLIAYNMKKAALEESVQKQFDLDIGDQIAKNIRYQQDTLMIDKPSD